MLNKKERLMQYNNPNYVRQNKAKLNKSRTLMGLVSLVLPAVMFLAPGAASAAATTVVVTPTIEHGWSATAPLADTRPGGAVNFINDATAPAGGGALQLTTNNLNSAKAQYMHAAGIPLSAVTELSYYTKQNSASYFGGDASYQLPILGNGTSGFTTLVYEPYQGGSVIPVIPGIWQRWDVYGGLFWSSKDVICSNGTLSAGYGGAPFYSLAEVKAKCPAAVVVAYGVDIGSYNPSYNVETDLFNFNGTTYNFELTNKPSSKDECKKDGWMNLTDQNGQPFKNQGQCVSWTKSAGEQENETND
jgi:hypothetical protein